MPCQRGQRDPGLTLCHQHFARDLIARKAKRYLMRKRHRHHRGRDSLWLVIDLDVCSRRL